MQRLPLIGGSYVARSVIASATRCINLYPEANPKDALVPMTHYQRPGLVPLCKPTTPAIGRGVWQASNGVGYAVIGTSLYLVESNFSYTKLGDLTPNRTNPCSLIDNGITAMVVDGGPKGFEVDLATRTFQAIVDPTGIFQGADRVDYIDGFILWNLPNSRDFGSTLFGVVKFDGTYSAGKTDYPDLLQTLIVNRHEIILLGSLKSEIWYNAGNATFPFAELPGAYIEHGIVAKYSVAAADISTFWLGRDLQGDGIVFRQRGYQTTRISNHALELAIRQMKNTVGISDAIGYTYQVDGHVFYVLTFPAGDQTWVFDEAIADPMLAWHQQAWTSTADGLLHRHRGMMAAVLYGKNVCIDWENGTLYEMSLDAYVDTVNDIACPLTCIRTFPHIGTAREGRQAAEVNGRRVMFNRFWADIEVGTVPVDVDGNPAQVSLRWSDDRGKSWGNDVLQSAGELGQFLTQPQWPGLGIARDRLFEIAHSIAGPAALNGAWVDAEILAEQ